MASWSDVAKKIDTLLSIAKAYEKGIGTNKINFSELKNAVDDVRKDLDVLEKLSKGTSILDMAHLFIKDVEKARPEYRVILDTAYADGLALFLQYKKGDKKGQIVANIFASKSKIQLKPAIGFNDSKDERLIVAEIIKIFGREPNILDAE